MSTTFSPSRYDPIMFLDLLAMQPAGGDANPLVSFLPIIIIFAIFWFFIIRPQKQKEEQRKEMINAVEKGDKIVTVGGVHGSVTQVDDHSVLAQVDSGVKLRIDKNAIANVKNKDVG